MLEKLREIDWDSFEHAYGPASDVPELFEALVSGDDEAAKNAKWAFFGNLWHQGTVYPATRHAVPFFLELLQPGSKADRPWIIDYLAHLATGNSYLDVHQDVWPENERKDTPEFKAELAKELADVKGARNAVLAGMPTFLKLLSDDSAQIRAASSYLMTAFLDKSELYWDALWIRAHEETDEVARHCVVMALNAALNEQRRPAFVQFAREKMDGETKLGRWGLARVLASSSEEPLTDQVVELLVEAIADEDLEATFETSPWGNSSAAAFSCGTLSRLDPKYAEKFLPPMIKAMNDADPSSALDIAGALLDFAFNFEPSEHGSFEAMTENQKKILKEIAYSEKAWTINVNMGDITGWFGLAKTASDLQTFCGLEPKKFKDEIVAMGPGGSMTTATITSEE